METTKLQKLITKYFELILRTYTTTTILAWEDELKRYPDEVVDNAIKYIIRKEDYNYSTIAALILGCDHCLEDYNRKKGRIENEIFYAKQYLEQLNAKPNLTEDEQYDKEQYIATLKKYGAL